jgi:hypothetical protein
MDEIHNVHDKPTDEASFIKMIRGMTIQDIENIFTGDNTENWVEVTDEGGKTYKGMKSWIMVEISKVVEKMKIEDATRFVSWITSRRPLMDKVKIIQSVADESFYCHECFDYQSSARNFAWHPDIYKPEKVLISANDYKKKKDHCRIIIPTGSDVYYDVIDYEENLDKAARGQKIIRYMDREWLTAKQIRDECPKKSNNGDQ